MQKISEDVETVEGGFYITQVKSVMDHNLLQY